MDANAWVLIVGAVAAGFVQGLSGFAFGLVATAIWAWWLGARLYAGISPEGFRRVVLALLSCTGVALLLRSVPAVWARLA